MYHSLTFVDGNTTRNTWNNWHLIPSARPVVVQPTAAYKYVDIPGRDGSLDLSNYLIGRPTYSDRSGSFKFYVANDYGDWVGRKAEIAQFLNGAKEMKMVLEDDPHHYYLGRFYMKAWDPGANNSEVTIEYRVKPYKYRASDGGAVMT